MKKLQLNLQHLQNVEVLTRSQLKNVLGGDPVITTKGGGSACAGDTFVCYTENNVNYTCSTIFNPDGHTVKSCCCGHYAGDANCSEE